MAKDGQTPYLVRETGLSFDPLIGVKVTIDLLQAFAAYYGADRFVAYLREQAAELEKSFKEGKGNAAYFGAQLDMIIEGQLNLGFKVKSDENSDYSFELGELVKGSLKISAVTNIRGGVRMWVVEGYFEAAAMIEAEGLFQLDDSDKSKLDLVFYHKGVKAKVFLEYGAGERIIDDSKIQAGSYNRSGRNVVSNSSSTTYAGDQSVTVKDKVYDKEWIIHEKLTVEKSKYRITIA